MPTTMWYAAQFAAMQLTAILAGALMLLTAWRRPLLGRFLYLALFVWACGMNFWTAAVRPGAYLEYGPLAVLGAYRDFIDGFFAQHVAAFVMLVAACQGFIAFGLAVGGPLARIGLVGAVGFLLAIAPLGVGSGFPSTLLMAAGAIVLLRRPDALEGGMLERVIRVLGRGDRISRSSRAA
jgi:hypothetical protein